MKRRIFSVGLELPSAAVEGVPLRSERSLLDADIILFEPNRPTDYDVEKQYLGKSLLYESSSFRFMTDMQHWRSELNTAFEGGKTIIIYLARPEEVYVYTGQESHSGTGRSRQTTKGVKSVDTYDAIPLSFGSVVSATGEGIRIVKDLGPLSAYWSLCSRYSRYEVYLADTFKEPILVTWTGSKTVGAMVRGNQGTIILLPPLRAPDDVFIRNDKDGEPVWTRHALEFGRQFVACIVGLDRALREEAGVTPAPDWTRDSAYRFEEESRLEEELRQLESRIRDLQDERTSLFLDRERAGNLRRLLYEKGKPLENAILECLSLLGFKAERVREGESDFDAVFVSQEGRFLGEAEGKDSKAVTIDKLSQLERNLHEDFAREGVTEYATGVLFANAFRLLPPDQRGEFFTAKCLSGAKRSGVALIRTPDLFRVAKYLKSKDDPSFAEACRKAFVRGMGTIVEFPETPSNSE